MTECSHTHSVNTQMAADINKAITSVLGKYQNDASADSDDDFLTPPRKNVSWSTVVVCPKCHILHCLNQWKCIYVVVVAAAVVGIQWSICYTS